MLKAILFDLDGTLVEAKEWHYEALNRALRLFGFEISREDHLHIFDGLSTRQKLELLTAMEGFPASLYDIVFKLKQEFTFEEIKQKCKPLDNVQSTLKELKQRGYKIALASNSIRRSIDLMLYHSGIDQYFDAVISNQDVVKAKPDPEIYLKAMEALKLKPEECIAVEDNEKGLTSARLAGVRTVAVSSPQDISIETLKITC